MLSRMLKNVELMSGSTINALVAKKNGIEKEYAYNEMQGDHIIPWSQGGRTVDDNLQMLCQKCNNDKSNQ